MNKANLKCPFCGNVNRMEIPKNSCLQFYKCRKCEKLISSPKDKCCVICAYSDKKCLVSVK